MSLARFCSTDDPLWDIIHAKCLGKRKETGKTISGRSLSYDHSDEHTMSSSTNQPVSTQESQPALHNPAAHDSSQIDEFSPRSEAEVSMLAKSEFFIIAWRSGQALACSRGMYVLLMTIFTQLGRLRFTREPEISSRITTE